MSASSDTRLIWGGAALGSTALFGAFTVSPLVAKALTGSSSLSGIPGAAAVAGSAVGAAMLSSVMRARGRAAGLRLGYAVGIIGAAGAALAVGVEAFWLLLVAMVLVGVGHSSNQLARFAGADLHPPERRASVIGWIVWSLTVGAALGPTLPGVSSGLATSLGLPKEAIGYVLGVIFFIGALGLTSMLRARPIPEANVVAADASGLRALLGLPRVRTALVVMVAAQSTMVLVMTITPLHVRDAGHGLGVVGLVMSAHFVGMFGLSPVVGRITPHIGAKPMMMVGLVTLFVASVGAAMTTSEHSAPVGAWLFLLGLGWNIAFVAASAVLSHGLDYRARVTVQGGVETITWTASAIASAISGVLLQRFGFDVLSFAGAAIVAIAMIMLVRGYVGSPSVVQGADA